MANENHFHNQSAQVAAQGSINNSTVTQNVHVRNVIASVEDENEKKPRYYVEEPRVPNFVGRKDILSAAEAHLLPSTEHETGPNRRIFVIQGIGGTGKTQIALHFAETHRTRFWAIAMIDARNSASIDKSFQEIGKKANILSIADKDEKARNAVKNWLANLPSDRNWLLIIDGANNPKIDIDKNCFPPGGRGAILITTICPTLLLPVSHEDKQSLSKQSSIHGLDLESAITLMMNTSQETASEGCLVEARKVCEKLEGLPLAIIHAGSMIRNGHWTFHNFLNEFNEYQRGLYVSMGSKESKSGYQSLYGTTIACRDMIQERSRDGKTPEAADALDILTACSLLDHRSIPFKIFERLPRRSQEKKGLLGGLSRVFPTFADDSPPQSWGYSRWRTAIIMLADYSLATYNRTSQEFSIHGSVHQWICLELKYNGGAHMRKWARSAVSFGLTTLIDPDLRDQKHQAQRVMLVSHVTAFLEQDVEAFEISDVVDELSAEKYAFCYLDTGHYDLAERWYRRCIAFCEQIQKQDHSRYLTALTSLSEVLERKGEFAEASTLSQEAKDGWMTLNPMSRSALRSRQILALSLKGLGKFAAAKEELFGFLNLSTAGSGLRDESSLETIAILVDVLRYEGDVNGAVERSEQNFERRKRLLGFEHQDTLESARSFAMVLLEHGSRLDLATSIMERVCRSRENTLGSHHPDTILSLSSLSKLLKKKGNYVRAEEEQKKALHRLMGVVGPGHPDTLSMMTSLGDLCLQKNQISEAEGLFRTAYCGYLENENFGPEHSHTLTSQLNVAFALQIRGQLDEANEIYKEMMESFRANGMERSPDALHCMTNLSDLCTLRGDYARAEALALDVSAEYQILHGHSSPAYYSALLLTSRAVLCQKRYGEAENILIIARNGLAEVCGMGSPKTLEALAMLALTVSYQGRGQESLDMFREASDGFKTLGDHQHWCHEDAHG